MKLCLEMWLLIYLLSVIIPCDLKSTNDTEQLTKGGYRVKKGEFQYLVSIRNAKDTEKHIGFGSIIHPKWILTVRNLFVSLKTDPKDTKFSNVVVIPKYGNELRDLKNREKISVTRYYCLPLMKGRTDVETDLGLLELSKPIKLGNQTQYDFQAVRMIRSNFAWENYKYLDNYVRSTGWGPKCWGSKDKCLRVISSTKDPVDCSSDMGTIRHPYGFCLANAFSSLCSGDVGTPGVIRANSDIVVGVAAVGSPKCKRR